MHINSQKEMTDMIDAINTQAALFNESEDKPYKIEFSMGYCTYKSKLESKDEFFKRLDASMYEDKRRKIREGIIADRRQNS